jgi:gliotoxin/aspirochlorine biosynthesis thioredoxin reductase
MHVSRMAKRLAQRVTIYTNGDNDRALAFQSLVSSDDDLEIDARPIARLENSQTGTGLVIHFKDGSHAKQAFLVSIDF